MSRDDWRYDREYDQWDRLDGVWAAPFLRKPRPYVVFKGGGKPEMLMARKYPKRFATPKEAMKAADEKWPMRTEE